MNETKIKTDSLFFASLVTPSAIVHVQDDLSPAVEQIARDVAAIQSPRLYFVGCGASLAAMYGAKYLLDRFSTVSSDVYTGWQFLGRAPFALGEQSFVFLTSYSGETPEVLQAKQLAVERGAISVAITNTKKTPLAMDAWAVLDYESKAVYTAPLAIMYLLSAHIIKARGECVKMADDIIGELRALPDKIATLADKTRQPARKLAEQFADAEGFYVLGSGPLYGLAYKLSLSVITENLWLDGCPIDAGEFYHGPIEVVPASSDVHQRMMLMQLVGTDRSRAVSEQVLAFCRKRGVRQVVFDAKDYPEFGDLFSPFALFVPTEWFVMYMAAQKSHDVDERRYMGKLGARWGEYEPA